MVISRSKTKSEAGPFGDELRQLVDPSRFGDPRVLKEPVIRIVTSPDEILTAQRLHAYIYLGEGFVEEGDVTYDGVLSDEADPDKDRSTYFTISDQESLGKPVMVVRQIHYEPERSFPVLKHLVIYPEAMTEIDELDLSRCVEISALAKLRGTPHQIALLIYRKMWHHSLNENHLNWFMAPDKDVSGYLQAMFGSALRVIGEPQYYMGSISVPMTLDCQQFLTPLLEECLDVEKDSIFKSIGRRDLVAILLDGLDLSLLPNEQQKLIEVIFQN